MELLGLVLSSVMSEDSSSNKHEAKLCHFD